MAWSRRRSIVAGVVIGLVLGTVAAAIIGWSASGSNGPDATLTEPGAAQEPASLPVAKDVTGVTIPDDSFDLLGGGHKALSDYRGAPLVVNVWASWCPPCQQEMPAFQEVHQALGDRVRFVGLDRADSRADATAFAQQRKIGYDLLFDPDDRLAPQLGVAVMPTTLLVSAQGVVVKTLAGALTADQLRAAINRAFPP
jgi:thiol-disulfide isomerase/thioredoxin